MKSGVYTITNTVNKKLYVGSAFDFTKRWSQHLSFLNAGKHPNRHLQSAYKKYGKDVLVFEVLVECEQEFLSSEEHYWCNLLDVHRTGYNIKPTHPYGRPTISIEGKISMIEKLKGRNNHSKEFIEAHSKRMKGNKYRLGLKPSITSIENSKAVTMKAIEIYDLNGKFVKEVGSVKLAAEFVGAHSSTVSAVLRGDMRQVKGYQVRVKNSKTKIESKISYRIKKGVKIICKDTVTNIEKTFNSVKEAVLELSLTNKQITHNLYGASNIVAKRYKFEYEK